MTDDLQTLRPESYSYPPRLFESRLECRTLVHIHRKLILLSESRFSSLPMIGSRIHPAHSPFCILESEMPIPLTVCQCGGLLCPLLCDNNSCPCFSPFLVAN